jgi:hypothetical protein
VEYYYFFTWLQRVLQNLLHQLNLQRAQPLLKKKEKRFFTKWIQTLDGRLPKSDIVTEETHENKGSIHVEQPSNNKHFSGGFNSNSGVNYGWVPKGVNFPKVELKKFDGT